MQFLVCGYDGDDPEALDRRMAVRPDHLALGEVMAARGEMLIGIALLSEDGEDRMVGSAIVVDMPDRAAVDAWLAVEPYVVGDVWRRIEVTPGRIGPAWSHLLKS
jgi:uncharacterized protein YciI